MGKKEQIVTINLRKRHWKCHKVIIREHLARAFCTTVAETLSSNKPFLSVLLYSPGVLNALLGQTKLSVDPFAGVSAVQLWVSSPFQANALSLSGAIHCSFLFLARCFSHSLPAPSCYSTHFFPEGHVQLCLWKKPLFLSPQGPGRLPQLGQSRQTFTVLLCCLLIVLYKKTCGEQIKSSYNALKISLSCVCSLIPFKRWMWVAEGSYILVGCSDSWVIW